VKPTGVVVLLQVFEKVDRLFGKTFEGGGNRGHGSLLNF
jgi:hypothetical protein